MKKQKRTPGKVKQHIKKRKKKPQPTIYNPKKELANTCPICDIFSGIHEVDITDDLIAEIRKETNMSDDDAEFLIEAKQMGAKWNVKRKSIILPNDFL